MARLIWAAVAAILNFVFNPFAGRVRVSGVPIVLQGRIWVFAPVSLGFIEDNAARIAQYGSSAALGEGAVSLTIDTAHASLKRNYPFISRRKVRGILSIESFNAVLAASYGGKPGDSQGELQAPAILTGANSTPTSPPVPGGHSTTSETNSA